MRRCLLASILAALGAATVVLPALASSEAPTITATSYRYGIEETQYWSPSTATVEPGGSVVFRNPSATIAHGLEFTGGSGKPNCTGLPAGAQEKTGAVSWQANCTFGAPGAYSFICTVHPSTMKGTVTVSAAGTTTVSMTTTTTTPSTGTTGSTPPPYGTPVGGAGTGTSGLASLLVGGTAAVKLSAPRHGSTVHGSLNLTPSGAGSTLEVDMLAQRASLAAHTAASVQVARIVRYYLAAGPVSFSVPLNARARRALRKHGHLAVTVRVALTPPGGTAMAIRRMLTLHR